MHTLPGFWHAAARMSGRVDLSAARRCLDLATASARSLAAAGVPLDRALLLEAGQPRASPEPFLTLADPCYPSGLADLPYAPPVLFCRGDASLLNEPAVAIVGTRRCTALGARMARQLARAAADAGAVVVSGLAYGIDSEAHAAAPDRTVAVLGQGLGVPLHGPQRRLAEEILDSGGLLVTEFLPEVPPAKWTFPQRNRVIAGLARVTVVVEGSHRSGALITARCALDAGREVLAVPGNPLVESFSGCLDLLEQGARLVRGSRDLLEVLGLQRPPRAAEAPGGTGDPGGLLAAMGPGAPFDALLERTGLDAARLARALAAMELTGLVQRLPGDVYAPKDPR